jgi:GNAT superfamily N-acetyltransferase
MIFETVTINDLEDIRSIQPEGWMDIIPDFKFYVASDYCYPIKIKIDNRIAGTGVAIIFESSAWLAHIIVDVKHRNKGVGYQIVRELLKYLRSLSIETVSLIATELGLPVYKKAGFRVVCEYATLMRENSPLDKFRSDKLILFKEEYRAGLYALDREISGENREKLLKSQLENSVLYCKDEKLLGYYLPTLKEGLIYADTLEAGLELMKIKYLNVDKAALPLNNISGLSFLVQQGFIMDSVKVTRMILGREINWKPEKVYSRIGGNLG